MAKSKKKTTKKPPKTPTSSLHWQHYQASQTLFWLFHTWLPQRLAFVHLFLSLYHWHQQTNLCAVLRNRVEQEIRNECMWRPWPRVGDTGHRGFLHLFLFEGTLVNSGTLSSFSLSDRFFEQKKHSETPISQNTSPESKRCRCHGSGKRRRRTAGYRVVLFATATTDALCGLCEYFCVDECV